MLKTVYELVWIMSNLNDVNQVIYILMWMRIWQMCSELGYHDQYPDSGHHQYKKSSWIVTYLVALDIPYQRRPKGVIAMCNRPREEMNKQHYTHSSRNSCRRSFLSAKLIFMSSYYIATHVYNYYNATSCPCLKLASYFLRS